MSDTPNSPPTPEPPPARLVRPPAARPANVPPWWLPGLAVGLLAGLVAGAVAVYDAAPAVRETHRATVLVQIHPASGERTIPEAERQSVAFLVRSREVLSRTLAVPEVAALAAVKEWPDPVAELERRVAVTVSEWGIATVTLTGDRPDDLKVILDHLVRRFVDDHATLLRKAHDDQMVDLERARAALQQEIELREKAIELTARSSGTTGAGDPGGAAARLRDRLNQVETEFAKSESAIALLDAQVQALKRRPAADTPADPLELARLVDADARVALLVARRAEATASVEKAKAAAEPAKELQDNLDRIEKALAAVRANARKDAEALLKAAEERRAARELADLDVRLTVAQAARDHERAQRDGLRKVIESGQVGGLGIESMRRALVPQQEQADKVAAQLVQSRLRNSSALQPASVRGTAFAEPVRATGGWRVPAAVAGVTFVAGFVLATAFQLTGLAFHALRRVA